MRSVRDFFRHRLVYPVLRRMRNLSNYRLAPRNQTPYATHVPILLGLARVLRPRSILELGSGTYSTMTFLNRNAFPDLQQLTSVENDGEWASKVRSLTKEDDRCHIVAADEPVSEILKQFELADYDFVLLDDSADLPSRVTTIRALTGRSEIRTPILIHDFEIWAYRNAAGAAEKAFRFTGLNPNSGLVWWGNRINRKPLQKINRVVKQYSDMISPENVDSWAKAFAAELSGR